VTTAVFAVPGDINAPTGGYAYDRRVMKLLPSLGVGVEHLPLADSFPFPDRQDVDAAVNAVAGVARDATIIFDGLAFGAMPADRLAALDRRIIALVHHPLALESGLSKAAQNKLAASERTALQVAEKVIATSSLTAETLVKDYGVAADRLVIAEPGTDPAQRATGTQMPLQLLCVGAVTARKGYDILIEALAPVCEPDWRLTIAGTLDRSGEAVDKLNDLIAEKNLRDRVTLAGGVVPATLERLYDSADIFVLPSLYEGYGMVVAEAMARGLPIVCTTVGLVDTTVPDAAAFKVSPGDRDGLRAALQKAMSSKKLRSQMADASWEAGRQLPTWNETARRVAAAILDLKT